MGSSFRTDSAAVSLGRRAGRSRGMTQVQLGLHSRGRRVGCTAALGALLALQSVQGLDLLALLFGPVDGGLEEPAEELDGRGRVVIARDGVYVMRDGLQLVSTMPTVGMFILAASLTAMWGSKTLLSVCRKMMRSGRRTLGPRRRGALVSRPPLK